MMIPTVLGVLLLTFTLFALVAKDPARAFAGRQASEESLRAIRTKMGLDKPRFFNLAATTRPVVIADAPSAGNLASRNQTFREKVASFFDSQFFDLAFFRFPQSMRYERPVWSIIAEKAPISLAIQVPAFFIAIGLQLGIALLVASRRGSRLDSAITGLCIVSLAVPSLAAYIVLQWLLGARFQLFPVAGWDSGLYSIQYAALPILSTVLLELGGGIRFFRTVILEEINQDYVRTARSRGVGEREILLVHVLRNVMIPVVTNTITTLPLLIFGALILERQFQIPGLGGLLTDSILSQDRSVVMAVTYITSLLYCFALLLSDVLYTIVDPRVSFK